MASPSESPRDKTPLPRSFGPYSLTELIGRGGTAVIYKGKRRGASGFEKMVVVKMILPELARDLRFVRLFKEEAKLSAQLFHANIAQVLDFGIVDGTPFLELEYLAGWNLKQLAERLATRSERLPVSIVLALAIDACRGLAYAHSFTDESGAHRPIIHRDVSPANVMLCRDGTVKLLDFGLACITRGETLAIDTFQGKLAYMSPEQLERRQVDRRADVFAFGALLHELLTGAPLFSAETDAQTLRRIQALEVAPPSQTNERVPPELDAVVLRSLLRDPDQRYQSAAEMLDALERLSHRAAGSGATLAGAASKKELLRYLGSVAPEVYTMACDGCGMQLPAGRECPRCTTQLDPHGPTLPEESLAPLVPAPAPLLRLGAAASLAWRGLTSRASSLGRQIPVWSKSARSRARHAGERTLLRLRALGTKSGGLVGSALSRTRSWTSGLASGHSARVGAWRSALSGVLERLGRPFRNRRD